MPIEGSSPAPHPDVDARSQPLAWTEQWRAAAELALQQHGIVSRRQLRAAGFSDGTIDRACVSARLHPVFRAAYGLGYPPKTREALLVAATLACGDGAVVSHGTAAALLGLWDNPPELIDVIAPVEAGRKISDIRRRHVPPPTPEEAWVHDGVPCTSPARTIVDIASLRASPARRARAIRATIEEAAVKRMLNIPEIDAVLDGPRRRGSRLLLRIAEPWRRYPPGLVIRSRMEAKMLPLLTEFAVPIPRINERLSVGGERFEIDFLWPTARLVVETDGGLVHGTPEAARRDAHRDQALRAAGFRVRRLTWDDVAHHPESTMTELNRLLRDPSRPPPADCSFPA